MQVSEGKAMTRFEAYKARGYGYGLKKDVIGVIGVFDTEEEAAKAAQAFTNESLPNNHPECYDMGQVREIFTPDLK